MSDKDLKINFRYLTGNIACMSVYSIEGKPVHNDINNDEAIIIFNSLVGEKENCQTVKTLLKENNQLKEELKAVNKGLRKVLSKRKKWKYRYYKEKRKNRKAIKYIEDKIQKSFKADYGLEPFERTDRLFTETVIELQTIEQILDKGADK